MDERKTIDGIILHEPQDFSGMRAAGEITAQILDEIGGMIAPGVTTKEIDSRIYEMVKQSGARSATIGYRGYQHASCISLNHVVCHGIPGSKVPKGKNEKTNRQHDELIDGDILNIDVTVIYEGWHGDSSRMYLVGDVKPFAKRLVQVTHDALMLGIDQVKPGNRFGDVGAAIQRYAEAQRCSVVRDFCGHGLGRAFHSAPNVLHYGQWDTGPYFEEGMFFTIEPMLNLGGYATKVLSDGWTAITRDKSLSAQFEHSIGVTADGCEIFTPSKAGLFNPLA